MKQAQFDASGKIVWDEIKQPPPPADRNQAGMFMDRPDLWKKNKKRGKK